MHKYIPKIVSVGLVAFGASLFAGRSLGQSVVNTDLYVSTGSTMMIPASTLYFGPSANTVANGELYLYSNNIWLSPTAATSGSGKIAVRNPADQSLSTGAINIDGNNGNYITTATVSVENPEGIQLTDLTAPFDQPGWTTTAGNSSLNIGGNLSLDVDGANIILDPAETGDLSFNSAGSVSNYSASRMIVTNNNLISHIVKDQSANSTFVYPVGIAAGDYTPATLEGAGTYHVSEIDYTQGSSLPQIIIPAKGINRTWQIFGGVATSITLQHNAITNGAIYDDYGDASAFVTQYQGSSNWGSPSAATEQLSIGVHKDTYFAPLIPATATDLSFFSKSVDLAAPLPVTLTDFTAIRSGNTALLRWTTAQEHGNAGFSVERSADSKTWSSIGYVVSKAEDGSNSSAPLNYSFPDQAPLSGINIYRLKQVDRDGKYDYSKIRTLSFDESGTLKLYPNPATSEVSIAGAPLGSVIRIVGTDGKLYQVGTVLTSPQALNVSGLVSGMYFVQVFKDHALLQTTKLIKK